LAKTLRICDVQESRSIFGFRECLERFSNGDPDDTAILDADCHAGARSFQFSHSGVWLVRSGGFLTSQC